MKSIIFFIFTLLFCPSISDKTGLTSVPSFLKFIPPEKRIAMENIILNQTLSQNQVNSKLDEWGLTLGRLFNNLYLSHKNAFLETKKQLKEKHNLMLQQETDEEYKKVDSQIQALADNLDMPIIEIRRGIQSIINNQTEEMKQKIKEKAPY
uniref:DUF148 domain-containing protein n=1 Tax=Strongyloides stercoralis TaxID=6248 RepID=A0A0K0DSD6_STRER